MERKSRKEPVLAVTAIHDIVCNSSAWHPCDGDVIDAQPRLKLTVTRNVEPAGYKRSTREIWLGSEDHSVFGFASSLSAALRVPGPIVLV
jgi:hypothetical protein